MEEGPPKLDSDPKRGDIAGSSSPQLLRRSSLLQLQRLLLLAVAFSSTLDCASALAAAAKKGGGGGKKTPAAASSAGRGMKGSAAAAGFGSVPSSSPTLEETLAGFRRRPVRLLPLDAECPCGGISPPGVSLSYGDCCAPLHRGDEQCLTPLQVLQSRYSAFYLRNIGHVINTTHPTCRDYNDDKIKWAKALNKNGMFDSFQFVSLTVLDDWGDDAITAVADDVENEAFLKFHVRLREKEEEVDGTASTSSTETAVAGRETVIEELSRFLRDPVTGVWKYAGGDVRCLEAGLEGATLNS